MWAPALYALVGDLYKNIFNFPMSLTKTESNFKGARVSKTVYPTVAQNMADVNKNIG